MREDWHQYEKALEAAIDLITRTNIDDNDKKLILDFKDRLIVEGISKPRIIKYLHSLKMLSVWLEKGFRNAKEEDIVHLVSFVEQQQYSEWTKHSNHNAIFFII
ncbi:MAG: hypothetical protein HY363_02380 [Candidatus Aenigmarchaeota archaeon]|nr:hypothetical protein [Candidatus Aenigmarchaeota archaeon]